MLERNEMKADELTMNWMDKWSSGAQSEQLQSPVMASRNLPLRHKRLSSGFMVQPELPYFVSLNSDVLSSDIMIYGLKEGETVLGSRDLTAEIGMNLNR
jgi:hypothetical protein